MAITTKYITKPTGAGTLTFPTIGTISTTDQAETFSAIKTYNANCIRFTSGALPGSPTIGDLGFLTDDVFITITTGTAVKGFVLDDGSRLTSGILPIATTNGRLINSRLIQNDYFTVTNNTNADLFEIALTAGTSAGGELCYTLLVGDGTDLQVSSGCVKYAVTNKSGVYTTDLLVSELSEVLTSGTLTTDTWDLISGTNKVTMRCKFTSSLTPTSMRLRYVLKNNSGQVITQL